MPGIPDAVIEPWLWLSGSIAIAVVVAQIAWYAGRVHAERVRNAVARWADWPYAGWLVQLVRLIYYVGVPFAALTWGRALSARYAGLQDWDWLALWLGGTTPTAQAEAVWLEWLRDAGRVCLVGAGGWTFLALAWWAYRRALGPAPSTAPDLPANGWAHLWEAALHETHWAFYRSAPALLLGTYWGAWAGLVLIAVEALLNPAWWERLGDPVRAFDARVRAVMAVLSTLVFLWAGNLWLAVAVHWALSWASAAWARALPLPLPAPPSGIEVAQEG